MSQFFSFLTLKRSSLKLKEIFFKKKYWYQVPLTQSKHYFIIKTYIKILYLKIIYLKSVVDVNTLQFICACTTKKEHWNHTRKYMTSNFLPNNYQTITYYYYTFKRYKHIIHIFWRYFATLQSYILKLHVRKYKRVTEAGKERV